MNWRLFSLMLGLVISGALAWLWPRITVPPTPHVIAKTLLDDGRPRDAVLLFEDKRWRGVGEYLAGRYRRAADEFSSPTTSLEHYNLGTALAQLGEWDGAITAYERVLRLDPTHADARHNLDLLLLALNFGRPEEAPPTELSSRDGQGGDEGDGTENAGEPDKQPTSTSETIDKESEEASDQAASGGNAPGDVGDREAEVSPETVTVVNEPKDAAGDEGPTGSGSVDLLARESTQAAEILLRLITDDPERVLRVRLHTEHKNRTTQTP